MRSAPRFFEAWRRCKKREGKGANQGNNPAERSSHGVPQKRLNFFEQKKKKSFKGKETGACVRPVNKVNLETTKKEEE